LEECTVSLLLLIAYLFHVIQFPCGTLGAIILQMDN
jgi:hypothetical protein